MADQASTTSVAAASKVGSDTAAGAAGDVGSTVPVEIAGDVGATASVNAMGDVGATAAAGEGGEVATAADNAAGDRGSSGQATAAAERVPSEPTTDTSREPTSVASTPAATLQPSSGPATEEAAPTGSTTPPSPATSDASSTTATAAPAAPAGRPPRRDHRQEPITPEMVEADTERAGDFLEGLLDALDVDGDITTWIDEVGGHIDLEGSELAELVGPDGETLDALQELTRLAVLRQTKRRARLLLDINGFRALQREQLVAAVKETVEQVLRTREHQELRPMTPAERKIVHDAVAALDGVQTESLGEEPNRRVVIRPA
jgi:spoIIIJ-associated protein